MRIYIASYFNTKDRLLGVRAHLIQMGHTVTAHWLEEPSNPSAGPLLHEYTPEYLRQCAFRDWSDIRQSDLFILDTLDESPRGGREVELGLALGRSMRIWRVGPARNVFHHLIPEQFISWEVCLGHLMASHGEDAPTAQEGERI